MTTTPDAREPRPRLCYLSRGDRGYGFHLHGGRGRGAQLVRRVEAGSPAQLAGLRSGDRVVEVNGENVEDHTHQQVVQKIMAVESRTRLLVVDEETDHFLRRHFLPCTEDRAVESSCFLLGRRSRPASATPGSLARSLRGSAPSSRRHSEGSQNSSPRGSVATATCDSHLSSASRSAPSSARESDTLGSCDSAPQTCQRSDTLGSCDSAPQTRHRSDTLGSCDSAPSSAWESDTLGSCDSAPQTCQRSDTPGSCDSDTPSPTDSTPLSSSDPTPPSSRDSARPLILGSSRDPTPPSPLASSSPPGSFSWTSAPSPPYDIIALPSGRNEYYGTLTSHGAPIITHGNQETRGSQDAAVTPDQRPRLCQVTLGGRGFGFNLHCDGRREGQYIRSVDPGSPAETAGLLPGDRLIQVNGQRIEGLRHSEVVTLIRGCGQETSLLVVDPETDALFQKLAITPTTAHLKEDRVDGPMTTTRPPVPNGGPRPRTRESDPQVHAGPNHTHQTPGETLSGENAAVIYRAAPVERPGPRRSEGSWDGDLHLSHTAAEARRKVRSGKKAAPPMTWSEKHQIFSNF